MKQKLFKVISKRTGKSYWVYDVWKKSKHETLYLIKNQGQWQYWEADRFEIIEYKITINIRVS